MAKCIKCGKKCDWEDDIFCDSCQDERKKKARVVVLLISVLAALVAGFLGNVDFNYQIEKCHSLDSSSSNYDFDYNVEIDARYNNHCHYINNHPLAYFTNVILIMVAVGVALFLLGTMISSIIRDGDIF